MLQEASDLTSADFMTSSLRSDSSGVQGFVGVDIPNPSQEPLIEEGCLQRSLGLLEPVKEGFFVDFKGIRAQHTPTGLVECFWVPQGGQPPKPAGISPDKSLFHATTSISEVPDDMPVVPLGWNPAW